MLFVLCHSPETLQQAQRIYSHYSWGHHIYYLPSTHLLETYFYTNILDKLIHPDSNETKPRWVGSISWKAHEKVNLTVVNEMLIDSRLYHDPQVDVLAFYDPFLFEATTLWSQSETAHPGLMSLMERILLGIHETKDNIALLRQGYPKFKSFFGTYFVAREPRMREYLTWLRKVMKFMHRDPVTRRALWSDSHYRGDVKVAVKVFGKHNDVNYPFHPFLGERLVQYYFNSRKHGIVCAREYEGKYNKHNI